MFRLNTGITYIPPWGVPITAMPEYQEAIARLTTEQATQPPDPPPGTNQPPDPPPGTG